MSDARVLPVMPVDLADPDLRDVRGAPREPLAESYARQHHLLPRGGQRYLLSPTEDGPAEQPPPVDAVRHLVSAWHPRGRGSTFEECQQLHDRLRDELVGLGGDPEDVVGLAADRSWYEGTLAVAGLSDDEVLTVATRFEQAAVVRWDAESLTVLPTGLLPSVVTSSSPWQLTPVARSCPMRRDDDPSRRCRLVGGPYGSRAIHTACLWSAHRDVGLALLGCDACDDGRGPIDGPFGSRGRPISLDDVVVGSRYGSYGWRR